MILRRRPQLWVPPGVREKPRAWNIRYDPALTGGGGGGASGITLDSGWTSSSGTFADGQIVTLTWTGSALNVPPDPRPYRWTLGDTSSNRDSTYSRNSNNLALKAEANMQTTIKPPNMTGSIVENLPNTNGAFWWTGSGVPGVGSEAQMDISATHRSFCSIKKYFDYDDTAENAKMWRIWPTTGVGGTNRPDFYPTQSSNFGFASFGIEVDDPALNSGNLSTAGSLSYSENFSQNAWLNDEFWFRENTVDVYDGLLNWRRNGRLVRQLTDRWRIRTSGIPGTSDRQAAFQFFDQRSNQTVPNPSHAYCHSIYQNDNLFRVFVSAESSISTTLQNGSNDLGIVPEMQLPVQNSGSSSGCQVLLRKGTLSSLSGLYLWLVDDDATGTFYRIGRFT